MVGSFTYILLLSILWGSYYYSHFIDEEISGLSKVT